MSIKINSPINQWAISEKKFVIFQSFFFFFFFTSPLTVIVHMTCSSISGGSAPVLYYLSSRFIQLTLISSRPGNASIHLSNKPNVYCYDSETCEGCHCRTRLSGNKLSDRQFIYVTGGCLSFSRAIGLLLPRLLMYGRKSDSAYLQEGRRKRTWRMDRGEKEVKRRREETHMKEMYETKVLKMQSFKWATSLCVGNVFKKCFQSDQEDNYVYDVI